MFCKLCSKHFTTANSFANHKQSKKHKELEDELHKREAADQVLDSAKIREETEAMYAVKSDRAAKKAEQITKRQQEISATNQAESEEVPMDDEDLSWEDIGDEEMEEYGNICLS